MAVHILGNTTAPSAGANDSTSSEQAPNVSTTITGSFYVTTLHAYFGATSGTITAHLLLINSNANGRALLADAGAMTVGGQTWQSQTLPTPFFITNTSSIEVGFWHTGEAHFSVYGSGTWQQGNPGSPSGTSGFSTPGSPFFQGGLGYYIEYIDPLSVSSVSPSSGKSGDSVIISGGGFVGGTISSVTFNGIAASFIVNSDSSITATVPNGFTNGTLTVNSDHGTGSTSFFESAPTISNVSPGTTSPGQNVTITGYGFTDGSVSSVTIDGISATYSVASNTSITATVPVGAAGVAPVTVNTNHGSASYNILVSSARMRRSNAWSFASSVGVRRSSTWATGSGVRVRRSSAWVLGS